MDLVHDLPNRILFALPKKGRLHTSSLELLTGSDIQFHRHSRLDIALVKNLPIALVFLPAGDIPTFVGEGRVDLGITGRDQVAEHDAVMFAEEGEGWRNVGGRNGDGRGVDEVMDLGFGRCELCVQIPEKGEMKSVEELVGRNVVTSFVGLAERYFRGLEEEGERAAQKLAVGNGDRVGSKSRKLKTKIKYVGGSVEAACALGVADGIVDLVESGETMRAAGLKAISTVLSSTAVLIKSRHPSDPALVDLIASRIRGVITAQKYVLCTYNVPRSLLPTVTKITPGKRAPTVNGLEGDGEESGWVAVSAMVERKCVATTMDELERVGATDILVTKIENSRTASF